MRRKVPDQKLIFVSDIHFPNNDPRMVSLWFDVLKWFKPHHVDLVGDIDDAETTSQWVAGSSKEGFSLDYAGITDTRKFLLDIQSASPRSEKHFHDGNHGWYRHEKWLDKNAPATIADGTYTPESLYEYEKAGFTFHYYDSPPVRRWDDLFVHHGEAISKDAGGSVAKDIDKFGISLLRGHSHRQGFWHNSYPLKGETLKGYEIGHMVDWTKMKYDIAPNWQAGFALGWEHNGHTHIDLVQINEQYQAYVAGKFFQG
jgi:hypothetical protein